MLKFFEVLKTRFKKRTVCTDNFVFRLHYKLSFGILVALSLLITGRQYFGNPIYCLNYNKLPAKFIDVFCWIHTTFSVEDAWHQQVGTNGIPYPGVDKFKDTETRVYHAYYQWVSLVLFLQALLLYIPRYFWKTMEDGRIKMLVLDLGSPVLADEVKNKSRALLVNYLYKSWNKSNMLFVWYVVAEMLNFVIVVGQMFLMDKFLGGHFTNYGTQVVAFTEWAWNIRYDPMIRVFPRVTKCTFYVFGSSGDVQKQDSLCILALNILNEKIYVFLWFWFIILAVVSGFVVLYRGISISIPKLRFLVLKMRARMAPPEDLETVLNRSSFGDWMMLNFLAKNIDSYNFCDVITDLARKLEIESKYHE